METNEKDEFEEMDPIENNEFEDFDPIENNAFEEKIFSREIELNEDDPNAVDELLSKEMMHLSVQNRNDMQEEIHGVKCLAVDETPELLEKSLRELAFEIDENTPDSEKKAYLQSQKPPTDLPEHQRIFQELHHLEPLPQSSYVNDDDFRLRFLRCELFDIKKSAKRMLTFLDMALELFGDFALRRPIRLSDFSKEEVRWMRQGRYQTLPSRDRSGRRVSAIFAEEQDSRMPDIVQAKITLYNSWALGYKDVETQRKGHVIIVWWDSSLRHDTHIPKGKYKIGLSQSTRVSGIHLCSPDTPYFRLRRALAVMRIGAEHRSKLRVHLGESVELQYALQGYGIPTEDIPISWTGKIKIKNLVQLMRIRHAIENHDEYPSSAPCTIVECPQMNDVLFRKGNSYVGHMGNARLRALIEWSLEQDVKDTKRPKQLANEIFQKRLEQIRKDKEDKRRSVVGRYLVWDTQKDWWNEMSDRAQICLKIEYMIREIRKAIGKSKKNRKSRRRDGNEAQKLHSGTNVFRSQGGGGTNFAGFASQHKRAKLSNNVLDCVNCGNTSSDDDHNYKADEAMSECFGLKFSPPI